MLKFDRLTRPLIKQTDPGRKKLLNISKEKRMEVREIVYFEKPERHNTDQMVKIVKKRMEESGIQTVVIAWSSGYTFRKFREITKGTKINIVAVTNPKGGSFPIVIRSTDSAESRKWKEEQLEKGITEIPVSISEETRNELEKEGVKVCYLMPDYFNFKTILAEDENYRIARAKLTIFGLPSHLDLLDVDAGADLSPLNMMSQGVRVSVGCAIIAVKNGLIPEGTTVLTMAGTASAVILQVSANPRKCYIKEIIGYERNPALSAGTPG